MYSNKQKMKLLRELLNPEHAAADLCLLREVAPQSDLLKSPIVKAVRAAEKILYALLDHTTAERIRLNRRRPEEEVKPETPNPDETTKATGDEPPAITGAAAPEQSQGDTPPNTGEDHPNEQSAKADVIPSDTESVDEVKEQLEETQSELEETKTELEETQGELEETREQLEEEKKSEVAPEPLPVPEPALPKDKKKTNTRPSTGKTSSTATCKSPRSSTTTE